MSPKKSRGIDAFFDERTRPVSRSPLAIADRNTDSVAELPINALWLDDQPRRIVPDAVLAQLIVEGRAQPETLLGELRTIAGEHPYYRSVLTALEELARTIESDGVLEPLLVVQKDGRYVLRDGHRRSLASLIAKKETAPVRLIDEASELQSTARQLVVNIQRQDLTALEKGRWLYKLARLVEDGIREDQGVPEGPSVIEEIVRAEDPGESSHVRTDSPGEAVPGDGSHVRTLSLDTMAKRALGAAVRDRVLALTGLGRTNYYQLLYLNRLTSEAQEAGLALSEGQLRPVTSLPAPDQAMIVRFIAERKLTSKEATTLVGVAKSGDQDAVKRVMAKLAKADVAPTRAAVTWEPLLHALPQDLWARLSSLRAELAALPEERRAVRIRSLQEQHRLAGEFRAQIEEIVTLYPSTGTPSEDER